MKQLLCLCLLLVLPLLSEEALYLRHNLKLAQKGDYVVSAQTKMATVLHIFDRTPNTIAVEEISVPMSQLPSTFTSWKQWMQRGAPGNTAWVVYEVEISSGHMLQCYSLTRRAWLKIPEANNFLSTLLNLQFSRIPEWQRKKTGPPPLLGMPDRRSSWQPHMIMEGVEIKGVTFDAYRAHWPRDKSILSEKTIDVYIPQDRTRYPAYFPYWLQISGLVGKAQVSIIDSGHGMTSSAILPKAKS